MSEIRNQEIATLDWHQQRAEYRERNHRRVVEVEGLRSDKHTGDQHQPERGESAWAPVRRAGNVVSAITTNKIGDVASDGTELSLQ